MVEALFNEQSDNAVGIEDEVGADCLFVSYLTKTMVRIQLARSRSDYMDMKPTSKERSIETSVSRQ